ncbi:MAG TPA: hypothetical protein VHV30_15200 [Polyangiaceae bacterium]|nr:hypothetical protein [Polyangiaceae bacterium]
MRAAAVAALALAGLVGCHRTNPDAPPSDDASVEDATADAQAALAPVRCRDTGEAAAVTSELAPEDLDVGEAVPTPAGFAVGLVRTKPNGRAGAVALVASDPLRVARIVELGQTPADATPPVVAWRGPDLVAAMCGVHGGVELTSIAVSPGGPAGEASESGAAGRDAGAPLVVPQHDPLWAFDLAFVPAAPGAAATGVLVWGDATSASRGVIRASMVARDHAAPAQDVSPPDADADHARIVALHRGPQAFVAVWIAHRPEPLAQDASESEAVGEPREFGWLEMVAIDDHGNPGGPVRRLTHPTGHVTGFDLQVIPADAPGTLLVVARDDGEAVDGSGGALLRVLVKGETVESPVAFETDGLGRGDPVLVAAATSASRSPSLALSWTAHDESARLLPLDLAGSPAGRPSMEDGWKSGSPLLFLGARRPPGTAEGGASAAPAMPAMVVAEPSDAGVELRLMTCGR